MGLAITYLTAAPVWDYPNDDDGLDDMTMTKMRMMMMMMVMMMLVMNDHYVDVGIDIE